MTEGIYKTDVFTAGTEGYYLYRNPGLALLDGQTIIAFSEARTEAREHGSDWAPSGIAVRVSRDRGITWGRQTWIDKNDHGPTHNPTPIVDNNRPGTLYFLYQKNYNRVFYTRTDDYGNSWQSPREITSSFLAMRETYNWQVLATGIGHGLMLENGRMITPVWYCRNEAQPFAHRPSRVGSVYSDDSGETWHCGALVPDTLKNPSESQIVELQGSRLLMNIRNEETARRRAYSFSSDCGLSWTAPLLHPVLFEPICCASTCAVPLAGGAQAVRPLVFVNPDSQTEYDNEKTRPESNIKSRHHLTVRLSEDSGATWPWKRIIEEGIAGYSDVAAAKDGTVFCLYNRGTTDGNPFHKKAVTLAAFHISHIKENES